MMTKPEKNHEWLQSLVGEWTYEVEATMKPGEAPTESGGTEIVRSLGGFWIVGEGQGEMPGCGPVTSILTLGYDPQKKRFTGSWIGSMMSHMWVYDGELDESEKVLTLNTEGPGMSDQSKMEMYQDIVEVKSGDHRTLSSRHLGDDGKWQTFMTANYRRKK